MQKPVREYYYSREPGTVVHEYGLRKESKVKKGQALLTYIKVPEQVEKTIVSRSAGYLEYANSDLSTGSKIDAGEMLYKVKSNLVHAWYYIDGFDDKKIKANSQLWACTQNGEQWQFNIDSVKGDRVLLSSVLATQDYSRLYSLSQKQLTMYHSQSECVKSVQ
ncbi:hypothetical protein HG263_12410 [Pseudoalteromonas sp. JBTF-M23]|uniref:Uncharacterized protein n=1 Tax=Pseudoalteromonas caenipelagi TaxID=2726988 RepID=A0A849VHX5_9GAMM|nr:hypothetical protein [Pseudoalteromonas caenipelagi]NOU51331.1 hypothetical protein [Pseudoalteromonas caenipelagi]